MQSINWTKYTYLINMVSLLNNYELKVLEEGDSSNLSICTHNPHAIIQCIFAVLKSRWINLMPLLAKSFVPGFGQLGSKFRLFGVVQKGFDSSCKPKFYTHADKDPVLCIFQQKKRKEYTTTLVKRLWLSGISKLGNRIFVRKNPIRAVSYTTFLLYIYPCCLHHHGQSCISSFHVSSYFQVMVEKSNIKGVQETSCVCTTMYFSFQLKA